METVAQAPRARVPKASGTSQLESMTPAALRADIVIRRQFFKHREYYVLKDPLALTYFRLQPEEAYILTLLDGKTTLGEIVRRANARYPNEVRSLVEVGNFVNQLGMGGLLNIGASQFVENARRTHAHNLLMIWAKLISGTLFIKIPLHDPSPWLGEAVRKLRFFWTKWFVGFSLLLFVWTAGLLLANADQFFVHRIDFFSASNLMLIWLTIIIVKTLHEFGHATTCRRFGGEVHEMGVCFLMFTPCGYVDASDAWMMRHQRHKLFTTIAGVFTELNIACIAAHLWLFLPDGLGRSLAFNAMLVASINTIVFNINPLMRFDGYYVLCDLLEIPNLRSKAISFCSYHLQWLFLGYRNRSQEIMFADEANARVFLFYAIAAYIYLLSIIYGFTQIFGRVLEPIGLKQFGLCVGFFAEGSFALLPVIKAFMDATQPGAHIVKTGSVTRRVIVTLACLGGLIGISFVTPTHYRVREQAITSPISLEGVGSEVGGVVKQVHVRTGQWVKPGDLLITLDNPEVISQLRIAEAERKQARVRFGSIRYAPAWATRESHAEVAQEQEIAEAGYKVAAARAAKLELRATTEGAVLTPDVEKLAGTYAIPYTAILRIGDTRRTRLIVPLTEADAEVVRPGSKVRGRWEATAQPFETKLDAVSSQPIKPSEIQHGMLAYFGGPVPMQSMQTNPRERPDYPIFLATAQVPDPGFDVAEGLRLRVSIEGVKTTVAHRFWRWFLSLFNLKSKKSIR
jgi:putative peptide zinc metalloprotease protein